MKCFFKKKYLFLFLKLWYDIKGLKIFEGDTVKTFTDINLATVSLRLINP